MSITAVPERVEGIAFRRGLTLVLMSLVVPGSAQLVMGNRRVGRFALRVWLVVVALVVAFVGLFLAQRPWAIAVYAHPITQWLLSAAFLALGLAWALLVVDAWRLARPLDMRGRRRVLLSAVSAVLAVAIGFGAVQASAASRSQAQLFGSIFGGGGSFDPSDGRLNVLLVGADADPTRPGLRTDAMMVASVDATTGRTVLFSLPRNLQHAPIPAKSPLRTFYPDGYWCADQACLLNAVYAEGTKHAALYPGARDPGMAALREVLQETLGLRVNYYAMIDIRGFESLIDALGGIRLDIARPVPIGGGSARVEGYLQPGKNVRLNGYQAIWFARSREGSSDYDRMARQKCVINAMTKQLTPANVLAKFNDLAAAGGHVLATDVPTGDLGKLIELADKGRRLPLASVSFAPPLIQPVKPDLKLIRSTVVDALAKSRELDRAAAAAAAAAATPASATPAPTASAAPTSAVPAKAPAKTSAPATPPPPVVAKTAPKVTVAENQTRTTDDLEEICSVS